MRRERPWAACGWLCLGLLAGSSGETRAHPAPADAPSESPPPASPAPPAVPLGALPLRRAAESAGRRRPDTDPCPVVVPPGRPCFPASVEVPGRTPRQAYVDATAGFDPQHGPTGASAPSDPEMIAVLREHIRPRGLAPRADFLPLVFKLAVLIKDKLAGPQPERFFLYLSRGRGRLWPVLREGRLTPDIEYADPEVSYALLGGFPNRKQGQAAYERLEDALAAAAAPAATPSALMGPPVPDAQPRPQ